MLVYDALRLRNTIQIIGICICNIGLLIYGAVQIDQIQDAVGVLLDNDAIDTDVWAATKPILIAIPCILGLSSSLMIFISWKLYDEFAWTIYKHISADLRMKRRYLTYQVRDCSFTVVYCRSNLSTRFISRCSSSTSSSSWALRFSSLSSSPAAQTRNLR